MKTMIIWQYEVHRISSHEREICEHLNVMRNQCRNVARLAIVGFFKTFFRSTTFATAKRKVLDDRMDRNILLKPI